MDFENIKIWIRSSEGKKVFLTATETKGEYMTNDKSIVVRLSAVQERNLTALYIDASKECGYFENKQAIGICIEETMGIKRYLANYMADKYWCRNEMMTDVEKLHSETQGMICEQRDGKYSLLLSVCDKEYKSEMFGDEDGLNIVISSYYHMLSKVEHSLSLIVCRDEVTPYHMVSQAAEYAFQLLGNGFHTRAYKRYPEIFNYLGWCSWDAMQIDVSEEGLLKKCEEIKEKKLPIKWVIIDDMWADCRGLNNRPFYQNHLIKHMYNCALTSFEADKERFPKGLKHCVDEIKKYGLKVGMWHPTTGYWRGIDPEGSLADEFKDCLMVVPNGKLILKMEQDKVFKFYNAFHSFFKRCGVEFVKIDNQSHLKEHYMNVYPVGKAARELHTGIEASVGVNFDQAMINCMCMANENMWNRPVSSIARCSGDFVPENKEWFKKHIMMCVYNSLFQGEFYWSDFDMWWTDDGQAKKNSLARAISGGPIYVSDKIGRSNKEVLEPLVYDDGRILRCDRPAYPSIDSMFVNPTENNIPLKVCNSCSNGRYGVVVTYNLTNDNTLVSGCITPEDIIGLKGEEFAVYEYFTKEIQILKRGETISFTLENNDDYKLYLISPFDKDGIAMLGRSDKFMSGAAIIEQFENQYFIYEGGQFVFAKKDNKKLKALCESGTYEVTQKGMLCTFKCNKEDKYFSLE